MIHNFNTVNQPSFAPIDINSHNSRIMAIETITGLKDIRNAFDEPLNNTEVELLVSFLSKKYNFNLVDNIYNFISEVIGISQVSLEYIGADYEEFYHNMTVKESLEIVLNKLIGSEGMESRNGFPAQFNIRNSQKNSPQNHEGKIYFPYTGDTNNFDYDQLLITIMQGINIDNGKVMYHGTSWEGALSIMDEIRILPRQRTTDFGLRNFYLTNTFKTACVWATRNNQAAIVVFVIPSDFIDSLDNHLMLNDIEQWKETVYKIRNAPGSGIALRQERSAYHRFIHDIDSHDLVSGPIFANPHNTNSVNNVKHIKYGKYIPYQYSFKDSTIEYLNDMFAITLFFESK